MRGTDVLAGSATMIEARELRERPMDEKHEVQRLRQRVQLLEALIDSQTRRLYEKPGHAVLVAMELRRACGLPPRPPKSSE